MTTPTIVCMGDSLTEGYEIDLTLRWTDLLAQEMNLTIINCGISGDTTAGMLARFPTMVIAPKPTCVIIMGGTNDVYLKLSFETILSNLLAMVRHARYFNIIPIIGVPPPFHFTENDPNQSDLFLSFSDFRQKIIDLQTLTRKLAQEKDIAMIDFSQNMSAEYFLEDGIHPNEAGQQIMMNNAKNALSKMEGF